MARQISRFFDWSIDKLSAVVLQVRTAVSCTDKLMDSETDFEGVDVLRLAAFNGMIECELPNNRLDRFNGKLVWKQEGERASRTFSLNNDNMLLRGTTMRNVDWAFGVVIFAGPDTKVRSNCVFFEIFDLNSWFA